MMDERKIVPKAFKEELKSGRIIYKAMHYCNLNTAWPRATVARVVAMSDIHGATSEVVYKLIQRGTVDSNTVVICTGDMGGADGRLGGQLDPTPDYEKLRAVAHSLYFVQGNHDIACASHRDWRNSDGTPCYLHNQVVTATALGVTLGGVSGICTDVAKKLNPDHHIYDESVYRGFLRAVLAKSPDVLLTHMPPEPLLNGVNAVASSPPMCLFGHAHAEYNYAVRGESTLHLNMDGRIFVWQ